MDEFIEAMADYYDAKRELEDCKAGCEYDADYFCFQYQQYVDQCKNEAEAAMRKVIRTELKLIEGGKA